MNAHYILRMFHNTFISHDIEPPKHDEWRTQTDQSEEKIKPSFASADYFLDIGGAGF